MSIPKSEQTNEYTPFDDELAALLIRSLHHKIEQASGAIRAGNERRKQAAEMQGTKK